MFLFQIDFNIVQSLDKSIKILEQREEVDY